MAELLHRLGTFAARRAWTVIVAWIVILALAVGGFLVGFTGLSSSFDIPGHGLRRGHRRAREEAARLQRSLGHRRLPRHRRDARSPTSSAPRSPTLVDGGADLPDVVRRHRSLRRPQQQLADQQQQIARRPRADRRPAARRPRRARQQLDAGSAQLDAGQAQLDAARAQARGGRRRRPPRSTPSRPQLDAQRAHARRAAGAADRRPHRRSTQERRSSSSGAELSRLADGIRVVSEDGATAHRQRAVHRAAPRARRRRSKEAVIEHFESRRRSTASRSPSRPTSPRACPRSSASARSSASRSPPSCSSSCSARSSPPRSRSSPRSSASRSARWRRSPSPGVVQMASVTPILGVMLGLAVGIDYSLFILYRHRKQLLQGADVHESIGLANGTAGNAVVFAGTTVIVALLALNITGVPFLGLMGTVGAVSVPIAVLIAISLTPALLGLAGTRILSRRAVARRVRPRRGSRRRRRAAGARPMSTCAPSLTVLVATVALLVVAIPALSMRLGLPDGGSEAADSTAYRAFTLTERGVRRRGRTVRCWSPPPCPRASTTTARWMPSSPSPASSPRRTTSSPSRRSPSPTTTGSPRSRCCRPRGPTATRPTELVRTLRDAAAGRRRHHARRRRSGRDQHRHLRGPRGRAAAVPAGRGRAVVPHHDDGLPLAPRAAARDRGLRAVAVRDLRRGDGRVPVGLVRRSVLGVQQPRADPELPAGDPRRHPLRPGDGLPALPHHRHAGGVGARRGSLASPSPRGSGRVGRSSRRRRSS